MGHPPRRDLFASGSPSSEPCRQIAGGNETQTQHTLNFPLLIQTTEVTQGEFPRSCFRPTGCGVPPELAQYQPMRSA
jgi:hypothetical protein